MVRPERGTLVPAGRRRTVTTDRTMMAGSADTSRRSVARRLAIVAVAAALVACGSGAGGGGHDGADEVQISDDALRVLGTDALLFEPDELSAPAGQIELALTCEDGINHNLVIIATGDEVAVCAPGGTGVGSIELDAGTYEFVCTVPGHSATMRGELTVD